MKKIVTLLIGLLLNSLEICADETVSLCVGEKKMLDATFHMNLSNAISNVKWYIDADKLHESESNWSVVVAPSKYYDGEATVKCTWTEKDQHTPYPYTTYNRSYTWTIRCKDNPIILYTREIKLQLGESENISVDCTYSDISYYYNCSYEYHFSTNNSSVATVQQTGLVTAVGPGQTEIVISSPNAKDDKYCKVIVESTPNPPDPTGITVSPGSYRLAIGETKTLSYTLTPSGATADVTWRSAATSVATVSSLSGTVTGISEGTARIWAETSNGLSDYCDITVYKVVPTSIQLSPSSCTLAVGSKKQLSYTVSPSNAKYTVSFKSSQPSVASVTSKGEVTALSGGQATITVTTDNGCSSECIVTVPPQPISISLPPKATLTLHTTKTLTPTMQPANALATLSWTTSDASVATVSNEGKVTACKVGQATITVTTDNGLTASCLVTIPAPHYWLQAWQKNGMTAAFSFSEHPEVTLDGTKIVVTSGTTVMEYQGSDFSHFTVVDNANDPTVVGVGSPQVGKASPRLSRHGSGWLVLTGCSPDTNVTIHNISGHLVATAKTDEQGGAELQLSKLGKGIFIIKIKETTFKITQR